jgi:putative ABC transport system substrate-binding protein
MHRRSFLTLLGTSAAAAARPPATWAQQRERVRRIGVFTNLASDDAESQARNAAFLQGLGALGWIVGRNVRIDYRWGGGDAERYPRYAAELIASGPEVILCWGNSTLEPLQQATRTIPIVFGAVTDPVGGGYVASLARPGGNATGFTLFEYGISAKWLELLKQIAPRVTRVAILRDRTNVGIGQFAAIQSVAPALGVDLSPLTLLGRADEIERAITTFASAANGGLIVTASTFATIHRQTIIALAIRHRVPAVFSARHFVSSGGLISYGPDRIEPARSAAGYVDRILRGEKPADLPVQAPVKYETVLNMKTAKALGLDVPAEVLVRADEVIE